ncbi:terminase large subunit [Microcystis phage Mae-Yong924-2]|nr:terminase large subunit [Microcystis phage Mae-Yong924-2]
MIEPKKVHLNGPQMLSYLVTAAINILVWGRGTGKSEGALSMFSLQNVLAMPRGNGGLLGTTYEQLLTRTLPPLISGWERMGYKMGVHFFLRGFAPEKYKWPRAYRAPVKAEHYIHWYNGHGMYLVSQDRAGTSNGLSIDWGAGDEAKLLNKVRLDQEFMLTIRGNAHHFGHLSNHGSVMFTSDMPTTSGGKWLLDYEQRMDRDTISAILGIQVKLAELRDMLASCNPAQKKKLSRDINRYHHYLNELRKDTVYFSMASTLDNIQALGLGPIKLFREMLSDLDFQTSVLNKKILQVKDGFYGLLDPEVHGYYNSNYSFIDSLEHDFMHFHQRDCRWDGDLLPDKPICMASDYNAKINSMVVGQLLNNQKDFRFLNTLYVKHPYRLKDLVEKFAAYYKHHPTKHVRYFYDHTALQGNNAATSKTFLEEYVEELHRHGWTVEKIYIGQAPGHNSRYMFWQNTFGGDDPNILGFSYNRQNCEAMEISMQQAALKLNKNGYEKDKKPETDDKTPPEEATHISDAADTLWWGINKNRQIQGQGMHTAFR